MNTLITILGPTSSGKSSLGIDLARKFDGEITSADSRQVYRRLDIGSGKVTDKEQKMAPHHLLDVANPMDNFSVAHFQELAFRAIDNIIARGKLPFLVGGTALYIYSVVDNYKFSDIPPNPKRRKELEKMPIQNLLVILSEAQSAKGGQAKPKDDAGVHRLSHDDTNNPRRLIRAIEKLEAGAPIEPQKGKPKYYNLILGIDMDRKELYKKIDKRVDERLEQGMVEEVEKLKRRGVSDEWLINLGLEYKHITRYLLGEFSRDEMTERLKGAIHAFARRQMTWFRRDKRIHWIKTNKEAEKIIQKEKAKL